MAEIPPALRGIERTNERSDTSVQSFDCALGSLAQASLHRMEHHSMGLRSGEYCGKYLRLAPTPRSACSIPATLWKETLSATTMSPRLSVGARHCFNVS